ncbi:hypothetical protein P167DRAFT_550579, partial [Morchella conica CCBAS932]
KKVDLLTLATHALNYANSPSQQALLSTNERRSALQQLAVTVQVAGELASVAHVEALAAGGTVTGETEGRVVVETEAIEAETERVSEEVERSLAETARLRAEAEKVARETERARADAEKAGREAQRAVAETERLKAEAMMVRSEKMRVDAVTERVKAETERMKVEAGVSVGKGGPEPRNQIERLRGEVGLGAAGGVGKELGSSVQVQKGPKPKLGDWRERVGAMLAEIEHRKLEEGRVGGKEPESPLELPSTYTGSLEAGSERKKVKAERSSGKEPENPMEFSWSFTELVEVESERRRVEAERVGWGKGYGGAAQTARDSGEVKNRPRGGGRRDKVARQRDLERD